MSPQNPRRKLLTALRKQVKTVRNFSVEHKGGQVVRYTCKACGWFEEGPYLELASRANGTPRPCGGSEMSEAMIRRRVAYENPMTGECQRCTRAERDRRYPLVS